jgi:hypothetical protein
MALALDGKWEDARAAYAKACGDVSGVGPEELVYEALARAHLGDATGASAILGQVERTEDPTRAERIARRRAEVEALLAPSAGR